MLNITGIYDKYAVSNLRSIREVPRGFLNWAPIMVRGTSHSESRWRRFQSRKRSGFLFQALSNIKRSGFLFQAQSNIKRNGLLFQAQLNIKRSGLLFQALSNIKRSGLLFQAQSNIKRSGRLFQAQLKIIHQVALINYNIYLEPTENPFSNNQSENCRHTQIPFFTSKHVNNFPNEYYNMLFIKKYKTTSLCVCN